MDYPTGNVTTADIRAYICNRERGWRPPATLPDGEAVRRTGMARDAHVIRNGGLCDSCLMAFEDEGAPMDLIADCVDFGADIADHICERVEEPGVECSCPCFGGGE